VDLHWPASGVLDLTLFIDRGLVELSAADGLVWVTNLFFPADPEAPIALLSQEAADA
jgi:fructan beta-fructosidase